ncbi:MAG: PIG-L family deacetylase [Bryobacteraceae bacterium]
MNSQQHFSSWAANGLDVPWPAQLKAVLDNSSFKVDATVKLRFSVEPNASVDEAILSQFDVQASIYRIGSSRPILDVSVAAERLHAGFQPLWRIPRKAATGRYSVILRIRHRESGRLVATADELSFAVWKSELRIDSFGADRRFYSPGDPISFQLKLVNEGDAALRNLRVEVGEWQYPWIASAKDSSSSPVVFSSGDIELQPGESTTVTITGVANGGVKGNSVQYTASVRCGHSSEIIAFRSTPSLFLRGPGEAGKPIYPASYIHSDLSQVRTDGYRDFYHHEPAGRIFALARTSFKSGEVNEIVFKSLTELATAPVSVELRSEAGAFVDSTTASLDGRTGRALLRFGTPGLYRITVASLQENGQVQASESVQVSANILPKSLVIIGAHPDDEFLHPAAIRAAVENSVPVHIIFLTSGDAGGSDRFFGVEYSPAEAIEFGHIRMAEARAAALHLGIPESNLHFLGLPDGFLETIRTQENTQGPIFSPLLGTDHSPYHGTAQPNLPFQRYAVLKALAGLLARIGPDTVYTSHPDERHADHKAAGWFTIEALKLLLRSRRLTSVPALRTDQFYGASDHSPAPFSYQPHQFFASGEAMARVQEAYWFYQTQGGNHARGHVLDYLRLPRIEYHQEIADWAVAAIPEFTLAAAS